MELLIIMGFLLGTIMAIGGILFLAEEGNPLGLGISFVGVLVFFAAMDGGDKRDLLETQGDQIVQYEQSIESLSEKLDTTQTLLAVAESKAEKANVLAGELAGVKGTLERTKHDLRESQVAKGLLEGKLSAAQNNYTQCQIDQGEALLERDIMEAKLDKVTKLVGGAF